VNEVRPDPPAPRAGAGPAAGPAAGGAGIDPGANVVGALSQVLADRTADAIVAAAGQAESAATALSALLHFLDRPTIEMLRQVLGLTHSGAVRLVDRLVAAGYVRRGPGADARGTALTLTAEGRAAAERVAAARADVVVGALAVLSDAERATFTELAGKVVGAMTRAPGATRWICRLCDTATCRSAATGCPTRNAAIARLGHAYE
jgi:DNA-binding MarR family transcriptional regulator